MTPSASPRCHRHRRHLASCGTCTAHLLADRRPASLPDVTAGVPRDALPLAA